MKKKLNSYINRLTRIEDRFWEDCRLLGKEVRNDIIIPICKKHDLEFLSGNGDFFFFRGNTNLSQACDFAHYSDDISKREMRELEKLLIPILNTLNTEVTRAQYLGYFVNEVRKINGRFYV